DGVADPDIAALAELLAVAADAPDVVLIVQRHVCTMTPPTPTGSSLPTGVNEPVRPTWISMSRSTVMARSAGNLCAIAQRGVRETKPSRSCQSMRSTL